MGNSSRGKNRIDRVGSFRLLSFSPSDAWLKLVHHGTISMCAEIPPRLLPLLQLLHPPSGDKCTPPMKENKFVWHILSTMTVVEVRPYYRLRHNFLSLSSRNKPWQSGICYALTTIGEPSSSTEKLYLYYRHLPQLPTVSAMLQ